MTTLKHYPHRPRKDHHGLFFRGWPGWSAGTSYRRLPFSTRPLWAGSLASPGGPTIGMHGLHLVKSHKTRMVSLRLVLGLIGF